MEIQGIAGYAIITVSITGIAAGRIPMLRMNRATIAFAGAALLVAAGTISAREAFLAVDVETLALLLAMMILIANLRLAGFFEVAGTTALALAQSPRQLLGLVVIASGFLSAFFVNDTICIMLTPLVLETTRRTGRNPLPYLIGTAAAANVGSCATIIGNPQNMLVGASGGIGFLPFLVRLGPPSILGLGIVFVAVMLSDPAEFGRKGYFMRMPPRRTRAHPGVLAKSLFSTGTLLVLLLSGVGAATAASLCAALVLVTRRIRAEKVFAEIDFTLLVFFGGLFVITRAIEGTGAFHTLSDIATPLAMGSPGLFSGFVVLASNLVSNVPAVMLLKPLVAGFPDPKQAWYLLAMSSTFAGNLTLLGSVANLIVAESASRRGVRIGFADYLKVGIPVTILTVTAGTVWIAL